MVKLLESRSESTKLIDLSVKIGCIGLAAASTLGLIPCALANMIIGTSEVGMVIGVFATCLIPTAAMTTFWLIREEAKKNIIS